MRKIELKNKNLILNDKIEGFLEREVTPFGNSAKVDCPKRFIGRRVYLLIVENESRRRGKATKRRE
jgi:putative transposon-encoded protein